MPQPILPPRPGVIAAFLHPGHKLVHRATGVVHEVERADRIRTCIENIHEGKVIHCRAGTTLAILVNGVAYREYGDGPKIADLWRDYHPPQLFDYRPDNQLIGALEYMEATAGFKFYPRQKFLISAVANLPGALVAAETGAGKTLIGISLTFVNQSGATLILVPQGVMDQWLEQFARFWPGQKVERLTAGHIRDSRIPDGIWLSYHQEFLLNDGGLVKLLHPSAFEQVVVDEAHLLQNPETLMGDALWGMQPRRRYALTATPVPNRIRDIYPLCRWLRPEVEYHCNTQTEYMVHPDGRRQEIDPIIPLSPALFSAELSPVVAAVRKVDLRPDLPPCHVRLVRHETDEAQSKAYAFNRDTWTMPSADGGTISRVRSGRLRNVCALGAIPKNKAIVDRMHKLVMSGEQVLVASARTGQSDWIEDQLAPVVMGAIARIDSTVPAEKHAEEAAAFKAGEAAVLLIGAKCAYGYSFNNCAWLLVASPEWGLGTILQVLGRVWRLDSARPVNCEIHVCAGTEEERVVTHLALKESAATAILYGSDCPLLLSTETGIDIRASFTNLPIAT